MGRLAGSVCPEGPAGYQGIRALGACKGVGVSVECWGLSGGVWVNWGLAGSVRAQGPVGV